MKTFLKFACLSLSLGLLPFQAWGFNVNDNHTGYYVYLMTGIVDSAHDTNVRPTPPVKFGNDFQLGYGLTTGYNITNWIAPELQMAFSTVTGNTPGGAAREYLATLRINAKVSLLTNAAFNQNHKLKFYPYAKAGGVVNALYVNAPVSTDKVGAYGWGAGLGGGLEVDYKALYFGIDLSNDLLLMQTYKKTILGVNTTLINGGFDYQFSGMGALGVHF